MAFQAFSFEDYTLLDIDDLIRVLNLGSHRAAYNRRHRGALPPAIRVGGSLRWRPEDVEQWLAERHDTVVGP